ncbi:MAG TPA: hypothetical protein VFQ51_04730 [Vicinamibacteria bacterium]|nr:hypothetical protein [Vicinamibacteria bacterium]
MHTSPRRSVLAAAALAMALPAAAGVVKMDLPLMEQPFVLDAPAEVIVSLQASCPGCSWETKGREGALLALEVDGRYSQHLALTRGAPPSEYRVALGSLSAGAHTLRVSLDRQRTPRGVSGAAVTRLTLMPVAASSPEHDALAHVPFVYARPGTVEGASDLPLVTWYETEAVAGGGTRIRYSIVFSNEDGGTPPDRLMATWGRLTDIEYVYGVELDRSGALVSAEFQGRDHQLLPFGGRREGSHPLLFVVTTNNMVDDRGAADVRFAPAPTRFDLGGVSREVVMDREPWTYRVSAQEVRREGRVSARARPGDKRIPDPRRFATLEACAPAEDATLSFEVGVRGRDGVRWFPSDGGRRDFRIARSAIHFPTGCFRGAVALPEGTTAADLAGLRVRAFTRVAGKDEPPLPAGAGRAQLKSVNRLFLLEADDQPGPNLLEWRGDAPLVPEGPAFEVPIRVKETK